jgi:hypothetical protein
MAALLMSRCGPSAYPPLPVQTGLFKFRDVRVVTEVVFRNKEDGCIKVVLQP